MGRFPSLFAPDGKWNAHRHDATHTPLCRVSLYQSLGPKRVRAGCVSSFARRWAGGQTMAYSSPYNSLNLSLLWAAILLAAG